MQERAPFSYRTGLARPGCGDGDLRLASFNVEYARDPRRVGEALDANAVLKDADILFLQEVEAHASEGRSRAEAIAELTGHDCLYVPARAASEGGTHGIAILSRLPLADIEVIELPRFNLHVNTRRRVAAACSVAWGSETIQLYNVHLDTRLNARERMEQLGAVVRHAAGQASRTVIAGDLNTMPLFWLWNLVPVWYDNQARKLDLFMREHGFDGPNVRQTTQKSGPLWLDLDRVYTRRLQRGASGVEDTVRVSDHLPVWIDLKRI